MNDESNELDVISSVRKLLEEINGENRKNIIDNCKKQINSIQNIKELSTNAGFINLPLKSILSVISYIDFSLISEKSVLLKILRNFIQNTINVHYGEKETIMLLQYVDMNEIYFSYEEFFSFIEIFTNCSFLRQFFQSYVDHEKLPEKDFNYLLQQKDKEIISLKQNLFNNYASKDKCLFHQESKKEPFKDFGNTHLTEERVLNIFEACRYGILPRVQYMIENENVPKDKTVEINNFSFKYYEGDTLLHIASINKHLPIVQYFIEKQNFNIDIKGHDDKTPLHYACEYGHFIIVEYLISKGANINAKDKNGNYAIHHASIGGHLPIVQYLIENQNFDIHLKGAYEMTPLHFACQKGKIFVAKYLIEKQNADINSRGGYEMTPIHCASTEGHNHIIEYLISKGANINVKNEDGNYPIHFAASLGRYSTVQYFIEKLKNIEIDIKGKNDKTPLHYACECHRLEIAAFLISNGAKINSKDENGNCAIHYACYYGSHPIVQFLVEKQGADVNIKSNHLATPLHYACLNGYLDIIKYLIPKGADVYSKDEYGNYAIHHASMGGHLPIVKYLIEDQNVPIDIKGEKDKTPLHCALEFGHKPIYQYLMSKFGVDENSLGCRLG